MRRVCVRLMLVGNLVAIALTPSQLWGMESVESISYRLYLGDEEKADDNLQILADNGDVTAAALLAERWSRSSNFDLLLRAQSLYVEAYDKGRGDISALSGLAKLGASNEYFYQTVHAQMLDLKKYVLASESFAHTRVVLDVFLSYPDVFTQNEVQQALTLYERSCIRNCAAQLYRARLAEFNGDHDIALRKYELAMKQDSRAVDFYLKLKGEAGVSELTHYAKSNSQHIDQYCPECIAKIAQEIRWNTSSDEAVVIQWLDVAGQQGSLAAMISKVEYMMDRPDIYSFEPVLSDIESVRLLSPEEAVYLESQALQIYQWRILNPAQSKTLIESLYLTRPVKAKFALAQLYKAGGLDEPNPAAAMEIYQDLIDSKQVIAFYRMASMYDGAPGVARDVVKSYGYARVASEFGVEKATLLQAKLGEEITEQQRYEGEQLRNRLIHSMDGSYDD